MFKNYLEIKTVHKIDFFSKQIDNKQLQKYISVYFLFTRGFFHPKMCPRMLFLFQGPEKSCLLFHILQFLCFRFFTEKLHQLPNCLIKLKCTWNADKSKRGKSSKHDKVFFGTVIVCDKMKNGPGTICQQHIFAEPWGDLSPQGGWVGATGPLPGDGVHHWLGQSGPAEGNEFKSIQLVLGWFWVGEWVNGSAPPSRGGGCVRVGFQKKTMGGWVLGKCPHPPPWPQGRTERLGGLDPLPPVGVRGFPYSPA